MALSTKSADLTDGTPHVASKLYAAAWRAVKAMGYVRLITYILDREAGTSAHAAGWRLVGQAGGGSWHARCRRFLGGCAVGHGGLFAGRDLGGDMAHEHNVVFGIGENQEGRKYLILGVSKEAWLFMKDGQTHTFDMSSLGLPFDVLLFGAPTRQAALNMISLGMQADGIKPDVDVSKERGIKGTEPAPVDHDQRILTNGKSESEMPDYRETGANGQQKAYVVLTEQERAKGFVRPVRNSYRHVGARPKYPLRDLTPDEIEYYSSEGYVKYEIYPDGSPERDRSVVGKFWTAKDLASGCGAITTMGSALAETYARSPSFYSGTYCSHCAAHFPVGEDGEFVWTGTDERVGT